MVVAGRVHEHHTNEGKMAQACIAVPSCPSSHNATFKINNNGDISSPVGGKAGRPGKG